MTVNKVTVTLKMRMIAGTLMAVSVLLFLADAAHGAGVPQEISQRLEQIYYSRRDLRQCFRPDDWMAIPSPQTKGLVDLDDWARKYGYREYPDLLAAYAPVATPSVASAPGALRIRTAALEPVLRSGAKFDYSRLTAKSVYVVDVASRQVLLSRNARDVRSMASITKLMTAAVALDSKIRLDRVAILTQDDEVGGARLRVPVGSRLSTVDLFNAMLVGSANNAAQVIARSCGRSVPEFVTAMNDKAERLGLASTRFVDPTGLGPANVSTAEEIAALGLEVFEKYYEIRRSASTAAYDLKVAGQVHHLTNTNDLLTDDSNGLIVTGGKTGYLEESLWNLMVRVQDYRRKPIMVVVLGAETKGQLFQEAETIANWVWDNYRWVNRQ